MSPCRGPSRGRIRPGLRRIRARSSPACQLEPPGREGGHLPNRLLEGEQLLLSYVPGEHVWEGAVESGVGFLGLVMKAVRGDERPSPSDHLLHVEACHVEEYYGDFPILLE